MDSISPIVVTSKPAEQHYYKVVAEHSDMVDRMANQSIKVQAYNEAQKVEANQNKINLDQSNKDAAEASRKSQELDLKNKDIELKRMALSN